MLFNEFSELIYQNNILDYIHGLKALTIKTLWFKVHFVKNYVSFCQRHRKPMGSIFYKSSYHVTNTDLVYFGLVNL